MKLSKLIISGLAVGLLSSVAFADDRANKISPSLESVEVMHAGKTMTIRRSSDKSATIPAAYAKTGRMCPPFCLQPMQIMPDVETLGELEVLGYLKRMSDGDRTVMVVDSRSPEWVGRGTIPGSVNVPWNSINLDMHGSFDAEAEAETLESVLTETFGAKRIDGKWDFRTAKTLVLFCNGIWCPQSAQNVKTLVKLGYPSYKLKWYRGGMQDWVGAGLTSAK